jgi:hypothetical protein
MIVALLRWNADFPTEIKGWFLFRTFIKGVLSK